MGATIRLFKRPRDDRDDHVLYGEGGVDSLRAEPRVELFRSILTTAFTDFFGVVIGATSRTTNRDILEAKREAAWFLLDPEGTPWGDSRRDLCNVIGENADSLRLETSQTIVAFEAMFADIGKLTAQALERAERRRSRKRASNAERVKAMGPEELAAFRERKAATAKAWRAKRRATETPDRRDERRRRGREIYRARCAPKRWLNAAE